MHSLQGMFEGNRWRGVGGEGAALPPQCTRCRECIADVDLEVLFVVVVVVVVVGGVGAGAGAGAGVCYGDLLQK